MSARGRSIVDWIGSAPGTEALLPGDVRASLSKLAVVDFSVVASESAFIYTSTIQSLVKTLFSSMWHRPIELPLINAGLPFQLFALGFRWRSALISNRRRPASNSTSNCSASPSPYPACSRPSWSSPPQTLGAPVARLEGSASGEAQSPAVSSQFVAVTVTPRPSVNVRIGTLFQG